MKDEIKLRLKVASKNKAPDWTNWKLWETVLKYLKKNKSRDPLWFANELYQENAAVDDLKNAMLKLFDRIQSE